VNYAPIILFIYDRPEHTQKTLDALSENEEAKDSLLFIYSDGNKNDPTEEQIKNIFKTKQIANNEKRFKKVEVLESITNRGLAKSILSGVTEIINKYEKVIVLEDDLVVDRFFLKFMNDSLKYYENNLNVACISGYIYPVAKPLPNTFFIKGADCWGWATWKRAWDVFESNGNKLLNELVHKKLTYDFNFYNTYPYIDMLKDQINGKNNSWAILWYASAYLNNMYTLYPSKSLVNNIGMDGTGTHSGTTNYFEITLLNEKIEISKIDICEHLEAKKIISEYFVIFNKNRNVGLFEKIFNKIKCKFYKK
jgi:hypothetical protein